MAVNRRNVEVRTELLLGFFLGVCDENLSTESHDGLVGATVTVGFEATAVHTHHLCHVFFVPENIVVEVAVAIESCLFCNLWRADRTVPHERWDIIEWEWGRSVALQRRAELSFPRNILLAPQATQQVVILNGQRDSLTDVFAKPWVDGTCVAASHHQIHAAAGKVLQEGVVFRDF